MNAVPYIFIENQWNIKNLKLQESEVEEVIWMDFEECRKGIVDGTLPNCIYEGEFQMVGKALGIE